MVTGNGVTPILNRLNGGRKRRSNKTETIVHSFCNSEVEEDRERRNRNVGAAPLNWMSLSDATRNRIDNEN